MKIKKMLATMAATAVASAVMLVGVPTAATAASCEGIAGEYSGGYTISTRYSNSSCTQTQARSYSQAPYSGIVAVQYGLWGTQSVAYALDRPNYTGGAINARYPTKFWGSIPGAWNVTHTWEYA